MDELKEIRNLLPEQAPPSAAVVARAKAQFTDGSPRLWRRRAMITTVIATAAAVATVATVVWTGDPQPSQAQAPPPTTTAPQSARDVLLVAANKAADVTPETGRYWRLRTMIGWVSATVGTAPNTYALEQRLVSECWLAREGGSWIGSRGIGARPATPADEQAWRRAGSPTSWNLGPGEDYQGDWVLSTSPDAGSVGKLDLDTSTSASGMTLRELQGLPTDVAALKTALANRTPTARGIHWEPAAWLRMSATDLLTAPVSAKVRSAAFQLLADLGSAESRGTVTDQIGRKGTGITVTVGDSAKTVTEMIINPDSGQLLSMSAKMLDAGGKAVKQTYTLTLSAAWTDDAPAVPNTQIP